jgi:pimeloyl-ACP methyl ester carboxylesterase
MPRRAPRDERPSTGGRPARRPSDGGPLSRAGSRSETSPEVIEGATASSIELPDGRRLAYAELGDPRGAPIIHNHGMPGSRFEHEADGAEYRALGVRVITPDRPGYGLSDRDPAGRLVDWPRDIVALAESLHLDSFGITGLSGGGIYALACAALIPERLTGVAVSGCPAPMDIPGAFAGMRWMSRAGVWLGAHVPRTLESAANGVAIMVRRYPGFFVAESNHHKPAADLRWMAMSSVRAGAETTLREAFRCGASGYAHDLRNLARPWGFALGDIRIGIEIWHGDQDTVIPVRHGRYLAAAIPGASLHLCRGEGHMVLWNHLGEVLAEAAGTQPAAA